MPIFAIGNKIPRIHPSAFIAPTADIVGDVRIDMGASVCYGAVIRGDTSYAEIGKNANIQDGVIVHGRATLPAIIEAEATLAHNCVVHGAIIRQQALIANSAVILDGAEIGARSLIAAGSVVLANTKIPEGVLAAGSPAIVKRKITGSPSEEWVTGNPKRYKQLADEHLNNLREISWKEATEGNIH